MAYNKGYDLDFPGYDKDTGTITLSYSYRKKCFNLYFSNPGKYFYAYIYEQDLKAFVGDVNFHPSKHNPHTRDIGIVIIDEFRGKGYGKAGLNLLIDEAFSFDSIRVLCTNFEKERIDALKIHEDLGFTNSYESDGILYLELEKMISTLKSYDN